MSDSTDHFILNAISELELTATRPFVKSARILAAAIEQAGLLTPARKEAIYTQPDPPPDEVITRFNSALVALVREPDPSKRLVRGQGNFGSPDGSYPAANPLYTECMLTDLGRAFIAL